MSDYLQPGHHPDPDTLSAFAEGVLPEHERLGCLAHLAVCPMCREVVYLVEEPLAAEPLPAPVLTEKVSFWKRWFTPLPVLSAAAAVGVLVLSLSLYQHFWSVPGARQTAALEAPAPVVPESATQPPQDTSEAGKSLLQDQRPSVARAKKATVSQPEVVVLSENSLKAAAANQPAPVPPLPMSTPPLPSAAPASAAPAAAAPPPRAEAAPTAMALDGVSVKDTAATTGIAGTIIDAAGGAVAGAIVKLRPLTGPASRNLTSDKKGQFNMAGLEPGRYELQVGAPGFKSLTKQVDIQPNQVARVDSTLSVGSVSESVSVTAESTRVQLQSSERSRTTADQPLPAKASVRTQPAGIMANQPAVTTAANGKLMLRTDPAGTLFLSQNAGKKWTAVYPVWGGKVVGLVALPPSDSSGAAFRMTTDGGAVWLSRDGNRWYAALPRH